MSGSLLAAAVLVPPAVLWGWRRRRGPPRTSTAPELDAAADLLAVRTLATWSQQLVQRGIQTPAPVRVRWRWATEDIALPRHDLTASPRLPTDPRPLPNGAENSSLRGEVLNSGLVTRLHDEVYARLRHGRLVLIGDPGTGKTGAMILLLVEALRHRSEVSEAARSVVPVPVWLTMGSWNPRTQGLREWVTATVDRDHPYMGAGNFGPDAVAQLFDTGRIALFLDGLDEMPDGVRIEALERLNAEGAGQRVVITSRPDEFRDTIGHGGRLAFVAVVELRPVGPRAATQYLLEGQVGTARRAWQEIADQIHAHPAGVLAQTLNTPLTLSLARFAYARSDPRELLTNELDDEKALRVHLLDHVLVAAYPDSRERSHATYWLCWLAYQLNRQPGGPTRDLRWWQIPGWIPRWQLGLGAGLGAGLAAGLGAGFITGLTGLIVIAIDEGFGAGLAAGLRGGIAGLIVNGLGAGIVAGLWYGLLNWRRIARGDPRVTPYSITPRWPTRHELRWALFSRRAFLKAIGLAFACAVPIWFLAEDGFVGGAVFGLAFAYVGLAVEVVQQAWRRPLPSVPDATPRSVYQRELRSQLVAGSLVTLLSTVAIAAFGLGLGLAYEAGFGEPDPLPEPRLEVGDIIILLGIGALLVFLIMLTGVIGSRATSSVMFAESALRALRRRVRFMQLLETGVARQVLRQAGAVYQFRHADLQDRLAEQLLPGHR